MKKLLSWLPVKASYMSLDVICPYMPLWQTAKRPVEAMQPLVFLYLIYIMTTNDNSSGYYNSSLAIYNSSLATI